MVEVCADQTWRAVAHSAGWGVEEAEVVCRQLSLETAGESSTHGGHSTHECTIIIIPCMD